MADENKVIIDLSIDGINKANQSIRAFDNLRKSIIGLSQPLNTLTKNINSLDSNLSTHAEALGQINSQHEKMVSTGDKVSNKVSSVTTSFTTLESIIRICGVTIKGWQIALTGGLSVIFAFLPEIVNLVGSFFKGKEAVAQMTDRIKGFNEVIKAANSDTATQTTKLNLLYKSATDVKKSDEERADIIRPQLILAF